MHVTFAAVIAAIFASPALGAPAKGATVTCPYVKSSSAQPKINDCYSVANQFALISPLLSKNTVLSSGTCEISVLANKNSAILGSVVQADIDFALNVFAAQCGTVAGTYAASNNITITKSSVDN